MQDFCPKPESKKPIDYSSGYEKELIRDSGCYTPRLTKGIRTIIGRCLWLLTSCIKRLTRIISERMSSGRVSETIYPKIPNWKWQVKCYRNLQISMGPAGPSRSTERHLVFAKTWKNNLPKSLRFPHYSSKPRCILLIKSINYESCEIETQPPQI